MEKVLLSMWIEDQELEIGNGWTYFQKRGLNAMVAAETRAMG